MMYKAGRVQPWMHPAFGYTASLVAPVLAIARGFTRQLESAPLWVSPFAETRHFSQ